MNAVSPTAIQTEFTQVAGQPRFQMYCGIHKGLRGLMMDTLARVGRMDVEDAAEMAQALEQTDALLDFCLFAVSLRWTPNKLLCKRRINRAP